MGTQHWARPPKDHPDPVIARDGSVRVSRRAVTREDDGELHEGCHEDDDGNVRCHAGIAERVGAIRVRRTAPVDDDAVALPWWWHEDPHRAAHQPYCYPHDSPHPFRKRPGPDGTIVKAMCVPRAWVDTEALDPFDNLVLAVCCERRMSPKPKPESKRRRRRRKRR